MTPIHRLLIASVALVLLLVPISARAAENDWHFTLQPKLVKVGSYSGPLVRRLGLPVGETGRSPWAFRTA